MVMASQRDQYEGKAARLRSPRFVLAVSIAGIVVLYLLSSLFTTDGVPISTSTNMKNLVNGPRNRHSPIGKYLYWGSRIDSPGKHCDTCAGLGHQESSLRCALEEALFLGSTFVMPSRMCINPLHNKKGSFHQSDDMVSEESWTASSCAMDSLYDPNLISDTVPLIMDDSEMWHRVLTTSMKLGSRE